MFAAGREVNPLSLDELDRIVHIWADACLELGDRDLKVDAAAGLGAGQAARPDGPLAPLAQQADYDA